MCASDHSVKSTSTARRTDCATTSHGDVVAEWEDGSDILNRLEREADDPWKSNFSRSTAHEEDKTMSSGERIY